MKFVSEITNLMYDTAEACQAAEKEFLDKQAKANAEKERKTKERAQRAKEVEKSFEEFQAASKNYKELLNAFIKDYGSFHMTYTDSKKTPFSDIEDLLESLFRCP